VNYRLEEPVTPREQAGDVAAAVKWLHGHALAFGGDIRLISLITEPEPIRKNLTHLGEPLEPPPISPARGPPTDWGELVQCHDDHDVFQSSQDALPVIDVHSL
jgi:hypothetical protein